MYADKVTDSMQAAIDESNRRREKQINYNEEHNITPQTVKKSKAEILKTSSVLDVRPAHEKEYDDGEEAMANIAADPVVQHMSKEGLRKAIDDTRKKMQKAAKQTEFMDAARLRDEMYALIEVFEERFEESYKL
jgi:excinuclease ABC subunit B